MINIKQSEMDVLINIIGAVETGGQIYGQRRYSDYTPAGANCSNEISCTIGAFQEYNGLAKGLLQEILNTHPDTFKKYDNAGIEKDLKLTSWNYYSPNRGSAKAKAISAIIDSPNGRKVQDARISRQMMDYIAFAEKQGVTSVDALFMCANFIHQGGYSACTRILKKTPKPYTLDNIYNACKTDTGNQVGAYRTRQSKVYGWLKQYLKQNIEEGENNMSKDWVMQVRKDAVEFAVAIANDNTHGYSQMVRSLYNITAPKSYDCSSLCCTAYYYAFIKNGLIKEANYLKANCSYTGNMMNMLNCGFEVVARNQTAHASMMLGDLELNTAYHVAMAIDKDNIVHARSSEGTKDTIDNSGNEIRTQPWYLYSHGWTHRLRFTGKGVNYSGNTSNIKPPTSSNTPNLIDKPLNKTAKFTGVVTATSLNVRTQPTINANTCSFSPLKKGISVEVCDEINGWYYIKYNGKYGFVSSQYIEKTEDNSVKPQPDTRKFVGKVYKPTTKVFTKATGDNVLTVYPKLNNGNLVDVIGEEKNRYKVNIPVPGGLIGYVNKSDIKNSKDEYPYLAKVKTNGGTLNLRDKPIDGKILAKMKNGSNVIVRKKAKSNWYEIRYKKIVGFASGEYLSKEKGN